MRYSIHKESLSSSPPATATRTTTSFNPLPSLNSSTPSALLALSLGLAPDMHPTPSIIQIDGGYRYPIVLGSGRKQKKLGLEVASAHNSKKFEIDKPRETHDFKMENDHLGSKRVDCGLKKTCCTGSLNLTEPIRDLVDFPLYRSCCTRPTTGSTSKLESPVGGSGRNKPHSSAICFNTSYSDKRSIDSQGRGSIAITTTTKLIEKHPNKNKTDMPSEMVKTSKRKEVVAVTKK